MWDWWQITKGGFEFLAKKRKQLSQRLELERTWCLCINKITIRLNFGWMIQIISSRYKKGKKKDMLNPPSLNIKGIYLWQTLLETPRKSIISLPFYFQNSAKDDKKEKIILLSKQSSSILSRGKTFLAATCA